MGGGGVVGRVSSGFGSASASPPQRGFTQQIVQVAHLLAPPL